MGIPKLADIFLLEAEIPVKIVSMANFWVHFTSALADEPWRALRRVLQPGRVPAKTGKNFYLNRP
jgi:hypothetical protein